MKLTREGYTAALERAEARGFKRAKAQLKTNVTAFDEGRARGQYELGVMHGKANAPQPDAVVEQRDRLLHTISENIRLGALLTKNGIAWKPVEFPLDAERREFWKQDAASYK